MKDKLTQNPLIKLIFVIVLSVIASLITFIGYIYRYITQGLVFSGNGDGFRQMMPFQMYLYEHFSKGHMLYDHSFGLGGNYIQDLAYYYSLSPFTYGHFIGVLVAEHVFHANPSDIAFWLTDQLVVAVVKTALIFVVSYYTLSYFNMKRVPTMIATLLYAASTVTIDFNFTWSFYSDLFIFLPLSILGIERLFRERKAGLFIFAIALTLFSNFYFSYYETIVVLSYFIYRTIWPYRSDILSRIHKLWIIIGSVLLAALSSVWGWYTGVTSFLNNDRQSNPHFHFDAIIEPIRHYHMFSNGFYITLTLIVIMALCSFKLYRHYFYRLTAIATWLMLLGSLTPYFDSAFNGFSTPERRWVYILAFMSALLVAQYLHHFSEISMRSFILSSILVLILMLVKWTGYFELETSWMYVSLCIILLLGLTIRFTSWRHTRIFKIALVALIVLQQWMMIQNAYINNIKKYTTDRSELKSDHYRSLKMQNKINDINHNRQNDIFNRIDYMSQYNLNSAMVYHYNGIALYSSIFDGSILNYYDRQLQINMPTDKNSTYRLLNNRTNLMALWDVRDRIRTSEDQLMPYGFKHQQNFKTESREFEHSTADFNYPSAHLTHKVFDSSQLKSPLDREQAYLTGVVFSDHAQKPTSHFTPNKNLLNYAKPELNHAQQGKGHQLKVNKNGGGITYHLPKHIADRYQVLYVEMDVELLSPDRSHRVGINEYSQQRNPLTYKYRRFVTPVTMKVKSAQDLNLHLDKGTYRYRLKGIYGEDYRTLAQAHKDVKPVEVKQQRNGYTITKSRNDKGYIVLPMAYREGLQAYANCEKVNVKRGNGIMTVIPTSKGQREITVTYHYPHHWLLIGLSGIGVVLSILWCGWLRRLKVTREKRTK
ncbi:YfhO family protein [Staphylococcus argensis]|uniref:YfhO family protein n=1 Tax=Staphylococcus argensis TaxID=1607738 RepID=UPI002283DA38|nr:YfhO family protein [Staphylococcus argensis]MCY6990298.1 YfhO family protein [Staphylococcus argensis]